SSIHKYDRNASLGIHHWRKDRQWFYKGSIGVTSNHNVYSKLKIITIKKIMVDKRLGYGYLKEIMFKRADQKEYMFMESNFPCLNMYDIEDMYLIWVQVQTWIVVNGQKRHKEDNDNDKEEELRERRQMRRLESFVGGRRNENDTRLLVRPDHGDYTRAKLEIKVDRAHKETMIPHGVKPTTLPAMMMTNVSGDHQEGNCCESRVVSTVTKICDIYGSHVDTSIKVSNAFEVLSRMENKDGTRAKSSQMVLISGRQVNRLMRRRGIHTMWHHILNNENSDIEEAFLIGLAYAPLVDAAGLDWSF
ncbi:hypothetical protein Tco_1226059, partial [Tanacetum coccineum]